MLLGCHSFSSRRVAESRLFICRVSTETSRYTAYVVNRGLVFILDEPFCCIGSKYSKKDRYYSTTRGVVSDRQLRAKIAQRETRAGDFFA